MEMNPVKQSKQKNSVNVFCDGTHWVNGQCDPRCVPRIKSVNEFHDKPS